MLCQNYIKSAGRLKLGHFNLLAFSSVVPCLQLVSLWLLADTLFLRPGSDADLFVSQT